MMTMTQIERYSIAVKHYSTNTFPVVLVYVQISISFSVYSNRFLIPVSLLAILG